MEVRHHYWSECIKAGKARNVLDYIWKNMKARLGKDAMREYRYYRGNLGRLRGMSLASFAFSAAKTI